MAGYYRKFIKNFAQRTEHLRQLTRKDVKFVWTKQHRMEFNEIKKALVNHPVMVYPDFTKPFILTTDASKWGYGAVLAQNFPKGERVVAYASRSTSEPEKKYSVMELEAGAAVWAIDKFRVYQ